MNRYMLRAIFRDRFRNILIMIIVLFCIIASSTMYNNIKQPSENETRFNLRKELQLDTQFINNTMVKISAGYAGNGTIEGEKEFLKFQKWMMKFDENQLDLLNQGKIFSKENQKEVDRINIIDTLCYYQRLSDPEKCTIGKACAKDIAKHKGYLRIDELPFDFYKLPYVDKAEFKELYSEANDNYIMQAKLLLSSIDNETIKYESKSPYVFLASVFGDIREVSMVLMLMILFFSIAIVMKWKQNKSFYCICNINKTSGDFLKKYLKSMLLCLVIVFVACYGFFFIFWGLQGGFKGLFSKTPYVMENFKSLKYFDHGMKYDEFERINLSKMYYDYYFDFGLGTFDAGTRHPYALMKVWQLFLASGVLAFVKMLFYVMLGAGIGFIFVDKSKIIAGGIVAGVLCVTSQLFFSTNKFNPFSVGNSFNTTMGGEGMTYLNAMLVLIASIVILYFGIMYVIRHKDIC